MFNSLTNKFLFNLIRDKPSYTVLSLLLSLSSIISGIVGTILLIPLAVIFLGGRQDFLLATNSPIVRLLFAFINNFNSESQLTLIFVLATLAYAFKILADYGERIVNIRFTKYLTYQMKTMGFSLLCQADIDYFYRHKVSDTLFKLNRDIDKTALVVKNIQKIILDLIGIIFLISCLFLISVPLTSIALLSLGIFITVNYFLVIYAKKQTNLVSQKSQGYNRLAIDFLTGIYQIKINANENREYASIIKALKSRERSEIRTQLVSAFIRFLNEVTAISTIIILFFSGYYLFDFAIHDFATVFLLHVAFLLKLAPAIERLNRSRLQIIGNKPSAEVIASFLTRTIKSNISSGKEVFAKLRHGIKFDNVSFAYPNRARIVLDKINFQINRGETIALVGSVGAGKSTVVDLLVRLYDPIEGTILIDGKNIQEYSLSSLRNNISIIDREPFLFNNSLIYNLTYGLQNVSETEIIAAAKKTKLDDFIAQLPQGLNTNINENFKLIISEAQRQLITITRAILSNRDLIILDLAVEGFDKANRELIQNALDILCRDRTTIIITNQLATIKQADRIVVLNKGKIVESGTHQQLLKTGNFYKRMCSVQFKTSQQSHQQQLAKKISKKLARQTNNSLSYEIRNNLNSLLNYLQLVNDSSIEDEREQLKILDESYQSAKNMLASLREYEKKISRGFKKKN